MIGSEQIYVGMLDENVDVWRPVQATRLDRNVYRIDEQQYDRDIETWQFEPGDTVTCGLIESNEGRILAAIKLVEPRGREPQER